MSTALTDCPISDEISVPFVPGLRMQFRLCSLAMPTGACVVEHPDGDCWGLFHTNEYVDSFSTFTEAWIAGALIPVRGQRLN